MDEVWRIETSSSRYLGFRSSRLEMFCKKDVLKNFEIFIGKHLCKSLCNFIKKVILAQLFPVNFTRFLRRAFLKEHFRWLLLLLLWYNLIVISLSYIQKCIFLYWFFTLFFSFLLIYLSTSTCWDSCDYFLLICLNDRK